MKAKSILIVLLLVALQSCKNPTSKISGTWQLTNFQYADRNKIDVPETIRRIKVINMSHFTWVQFMTEPKIVQSSAGGTFKFDGKNYTEMINWADTTMAPYLNKEQKFEVKIEKNKMLLSGHLSNGEKIEEEWIKIK